MNRKKRRSNRKLIVRLRMIRLQRQLQVQLPAKLKQKSSSASAASSSSTQQAWTLDSAKNYYLATVRDNDGNPLQLVGDIPTAAQNGPTVWQNMGTSNNGQTMNVGISGTQIFTITNNGDGTSTIQLGTITMRVRNSDHWILENNQQK